ncbi:hypothetical protein [Rhodocaloribacter sp.]
MRRASSILLLLLSFGTGVSLGQSGAVLLLETNDPHAMVFADSVWLGPASKAAFVLPDGARVLRLVPPAADAWSIETLHAPLGDLAPGDTLALRLSFPYYYRVETIPFGASVYGVSRSGRVKLGETPLTYRSDAPLTGELLIDRPGYETVHVEAGAKVWNRYVFALEPVALASSGDAPPEISWQPPKKRRVWIDYVAVGTAVAAGALAVHFKTKADHRFDRYRETGDPALRPTIERFDTYSGIALGVSQVGLGVFAIRLIFR